MLACAACMTTRQLQHGRGKQQQTPRAKGTQHTCGVRALLLPLAALFLSFGACGVAAVVVGMGLIPFTLALAATWGQLGGRLWGTLGGRLWGTLWGSLKARTYTRPTLSRFACIHGGAQHTI